MPDNALPAPPAVAPVDLAALIPTQRVAGPGSGAEASVRAASPERLAFLWTLLGAVAGSVLVGVAFLALLTLLP